MTCARMTSFSKWKLKADKLNPSNIDVGKQKILNPRGVTYLEWARLPSLFLKATCYLTVEIARLCFLNKSLVITGRFDGPSLILTLSAVKHLGKDNNSQFYDTVRGGIGVFLFCLFDLSEQSKGRMQST